MFVSLLYFKLKIKFKFLFSIFIMTFYFLAILYQFRASESLERPDFCFSREKIDTRKFDWPFFLSSMCESYSHSMIFYIFGLKRNLIWKEPVPKLAHPSTATSPNWHLPQLANSLTGTSLNALVIRKKILYILIFLSEIRWKCDFKLTFVKICPLHVHSKFSRKKVNCPLYVRLLNVRSTVIRSLLSYFVRVFLLFHSQDVHVTLNYENLVWYLPRCFVTELG